MINVLFLFPKSTDPTALDDFLFNRLVPGINQARGLRSLKLSAGDLMSPGGPPPYSRVVQASFDSLDDVMAIVQSPETQAGRDYIKSVGALILMYEVNELELA